LGIDDGHHQGARAVSTSELIDVGAPVEECESGINMTLASGMMQRRQTALCCERREASIIPLPLTATTTAAAATAAAAFTGGCRRNLARNVNFARCENRSLNRARAG
jgi:hypothetical protein